MRLCSTTFTHTSTAVFGLAVVGFTALRLAGYESPHLPGDQALPAPPILQRVPDAGPSAVRPAQENGGNVDLPTRQTDSGDDDLQTNPADGPQSPIARPTAMAAASLTWSRNAQQWRVDPPTEGAAEPAAESADASAAERQPAQEWDEDDESDDQADPEERDSDDGTRGDDSPSDETSDDWDDSAETDGSTTAEDDDHE